MKLNRFLTALAPVAIIGTIAPIISSCGGKEYVINYGDNINCRDKKAEGYQKKEKVVKEIKKHAQKEKAGFFDISITNNKIKTNDTQTIQNIYFDLVASILNNDTINLSDWSHNHTGDAEAISYTLNGEAKDWTSVYYAYNDEGFIYLTFDTESSTGNQLYRSYTYWDCTKQIER